LHKYAKLLTNNDLNFNKKNNCMINIENIQLDNCPICGELLRKVHAYDYQSGNCESSSDDKMIEGHFYYRGSPAKIDRIVYYLSATEAIIFWKSQTSFYC
jgi:hypothetical protein